MSLLRASHRSPDNRVRWFRYVRLHDVGSYMRAGWKPTGAFVGCHHGEFAELCEAPTFLERIAAWAKRIGGGR